MVMDGRRPAGIMGGEDPYADPRLAAVYRALAESPDTAYRGSVLPFRRTTAGETELAVPGFLMDAARGAVDLLAGPHTGQMSPEATQSIMGLAGSSAMQAPQPGLLAAIKAYHGSPHAFDRFDISKIGTGEGAQAYGHGLYFAGEKAVAGQYRKDLTGMRVSSAQRAVNDAGGDIETALAAAQKKVDHYQSMAASGGPDAEKAGRFLKLAQDRMDELTAFKNSGQFSEGSLYHVTLDPDEDDLLDWDAPLSQQPEKVRKALEGLNAYTPAKWGSDSPDEFYLEGVRGTDAFVRQIDRGIGDGPEWLATYDTLDGRGSQRFKTLEEAKNWIETEAPIEAGRGADAYQKLRKRFKTDSEISAALRAAGIPGLRYFDGTSRTKGEGTRNYVMFDDKLVNIDKVER